MDNNNFYFISAVEENKNHPNIPRRKPKKIIPSRKKSILEQPEIPSRVPSLLDSVLRNRSMESVENEIIETWKELKSKYNDPSVLTDMIIDDLLNWMQLRKENRIFVYYKLLEQIKNHEDSEAKEEVIEDLYQQIDRYNK
ncbi:MULTISPECIES: hypothetical protein [Metabacillus]|jgi:hypothetical protein|uniref:IDEAL domain-containing protein n=1 Tax=Metabacillus rhizolycopersici TaxID=2875709 RepID=A0ABS7UMM6_9BACI|nr:MULTISPECIES: hypothetical protein [Metabacillus]MBZ5749563.1 hypothetical protein [Metabacillus rhizolycopersici]MCM3653957.1 hypothetical protein [Metabacillus litoralis]